MSYRLFLFILLVIPSWAGARWISDEQAIMGTLVRVELWAEEETGGREAIAAVMAEMRRIDRAMSPYKKDSELSRVNREAGRRPVKISRELFDLIARALQVSEMTGGVFDITFASVGHLYDYRKHIRPSEAQIQKNLARIDYRHLVLDRKGRTLRFARQGVVIDLGGIAKGYAVDRGIAILRRRGVRQAIVTAGGDSRLLGDRRGRPWMIGIRDPRRRQGAVAVLPLQDEAISTSGDYERFFIEDGVRYHHILNPRSGKSATGARSASVIGPDATTTDALSTSVFILGPERGMELVDRLPGIEAVIIDRRGRMHYSSGLKNVSRAAEK